MLDLRSSSHILVAIARTMMNEDKVSATSVGEDEDNNSDDNNDEVIVASNDQKVYVQSNNSKRQLFLMCVGLSVRGTYIFDLDAHPWKTIKKRGTKPTRIEYAQEIARCSSDHLVPSGGGVTCRVS
jgi:hypothetical protein